MKKKKYLTDEEEKEIYSSKEFIDQFKELQKKYPNPKGIKYPPKSNIKLKLD